jgi:hypothetical protein
MIMFHAYFEGFREDVIAATGFVQSVLWSAKKNSVPVESIFVKFHIVVFYE